MYDIWNDFNKNKCNNANVILYLFTGTALTGSTYTSYNKSFFFSWGSTLVYKSQSIDISFTCSQSININTIFSIGIPSKYVGYKVNRCGSWEEKKIELIVMCVRWKLWPFLFSSSLLCFVTFCSFSTLFNILFIGAQQTIDTVATEGIKKWNKKKANTL